MRPGENKFFDYPALDEVLLDYAFEHRWCTRVIPDSLRIYDRDWAARANSETIGLGAIDLWLGTGKIQFLKPHFQILPGFQALFARRAFWLGLVGAEEDVTSVMLKTEFPGEVLELTSHLSLDAAPGYFAP